TRPGAVSQPLTPANGDDGWVWVSEWPSAADLDRAFPSGSPASVILVDHTGLRLDRTLALPSAGFPPRPEFLGLESIDRQAMLGDPVTVRWSPWIQPRPGDAVQLIVSHLSGWESYRSPAPGSAQAISPEASEWVIPAEAWRLPPDLDHAEPAFYVRLRWVSVATVFSPETDRVRGATGAASSTTALIQLQPRPPEADVTDFGVFEGTRHRQSSAGALEPVTPEGVRLEVSAEARLSHLVSGMNVTLPGTPELPVPRTGSNHFQRLETFDLVTALEQRLGAGAATFAVHLSDTSELVATLTRERGNPPPPPRLVNFDSAQSLDPGRDAAFESTPFVSAQDDDFVWLQLRDAQGTEVAATPYWPGRFGGRELFVPRDTLIRGATYQLVLRHVHVTAHDAESIPGASGWWGVFSETVVPVQTLPPANPLTNTSPSQLILPLGQEWVFRPSSTGGSSPVSWQVTTAPLPPGIGWDPNTGLLRGWPTTATSHDIGLRVTDSLGAYSEKTLSLQITGQVETLDILTTSLPPAVGDTFYVAELGTRGGIPPILWTLTTNSPPLPEGLSLDSSAGLIFGVPEAPADLALALEVVDATGTRRERSLRLRVPPFEPDPELAIALAERTAEGGLHILATASSDEPCTLEQSHDLAQWTPVDTRTNVAISGFHAPNPTDSRPFFFRVRRGIRGPTPNPLAVVPRREPDRVLEITLGVAGGELRLTNRLGTVFKLLVPTNALLEATSLRLSLVDELDGQPLGEGFAGGVELEPEGLNLTAPATLTITTPAPLPTNTLAVAYSADGEDFNLYPAWREGRTLRLPIHHFSGYAVGSRGPIDWDKLRAHTSCAPRSRAEADLAAILAEAAQAAAAGGTDTLPMEKITAVLVAWWNESIDTVTRAAARDEGMIEKGTNDFLHWWFTVSLLGVDASFESLLETGRQRLARGFLNAINRLHARAVLEHRVVGLHRMLRYASQAQLLGLDRDYPSSFDATQIVDRILRTWRFELSAESQISSFGPEGGMDVAVTLDAAVLSLNPEVLNLRTFYDKLYPMQLSHFSQWVRRGNPPYSLLGRPGRLHFRNLTFEVSSPPDSPPAPSDGCRRSYFQKPAQPREPDLATLYVSFHDPSEATANGLGPIPLWVDGLKGFHEDEYFRDPHGSGVKDDVFQFRKWTFTWRELVMEADYSPPPKTSTDGHGQVTEVTRFVLRHKPLPLRKSDQWLPPL
ncbi:MAG: hypothetical protein IT580_19580, partial [Verrucomicrobiales bacterium]|nr:hypothetical protein [Verrucomicrobiales bacterium]